MLTAPPLMTQTNRPAPRRDINAVLADHAKQLLAMPGVVGVYVGLLDDGKTQCLKLMLSRARSSTDEPLPTQLEGYPVVAEVTGEVRPR